jgi:hypothetical protein
MGKRIFAKLTIIFVLGLFMAQSAQAVVVYYPSNDENVVITDSSAAIVSHSMWVPFGHTWVEDGVISNAINITVIAVNRTWEGMAGSKTVDVLGIVVSGLGTTYSGSSDYPINIEVGAYLDPALNVNLLSGMGLHIYNWTGINVSNLNPLSQFVNSPYYEYPVWASATAADFLAGPIGAATVSGAFVAFHQLYSRPDTSSVLYSSSHVYIKQDVINEPTAMIPFSYLANIYLAWAIPYQYVQDNYSYTLTLYTKTTYEWGIGNFQTNETDTYIIIEPKPHYIGGCVLKNTKILTPDGYKKVQSLKGGDRVVSLNPSNGKLTTSIITSVSKTYVNEIESINNGELYLTPTDQPIYFKNSTNFGMLINPDQLKVGWMLYDPVIGQWITITNITFIMGKFTVYDISLDYPNNFIGNGRLLIDKPKPI